MFVFVRFHLLYFNTFDSDTGMRTRYFNATPYDCLVYIRRWALVAAPESANPSSNAPGCRGDPADTSAAPGQTDSTAYQAKIGRRTT